MDAKKHNERNAGRKALPENLKKVQVRFGMDADLAEKYTALGFDITNGRKFNPLINKALRYFLDSSLIAYNTSK